MAALTRTWVDTQLACMHGKCITLAGQSVNNIGKSMKIIYAAAGLIWLAALSSCGNLTTKASTESQPGVQPTLTNTTCAVKVLQSNTEVRPRLMGATHMYSLKSAPFQIEVSSEDCNPSIGNLNNIGDALYLATNPYAVSFAGMGMAGSAMDDVVVVGMSVNPRPDANELSSFGTSDKREISQLCKDFGKCPMQIFAFRRYWPFLLDGNAKQGKVATFKRFSEKQPISDAFGLVPMVVFTKASRDEAEYRTGHENLSILAMHTMLLTFSPR
jgi:hypothetical protein